MGCDSLCLPKASNTRTHNFLNVSETFQVQVAGYHHHLDSHGCTHHELRLHHLPGLQVGPAFETSSSALEVGPLFHFGLEGTCVDVSLQQTQFKRKRIIEGRSFYHSSAAPKVKSAKNSAVLDFRATVFLRNRP